MKKRVLKTVALSVCSVLALANAACVLASEKLLAKPVATTELAWREQTDETLVAYRQKVGEFSAKFTAETYKTYEKQDNFTVSPVSVFMALSLAVECADGQTRDEILTALGVTYEEVKNNTATLFRSLTSQTQTKTVFGEKTTERLQLSNSIWLDNAFSANGDCVEDLAKYYYCYSYQADFVNDNAGANAAIRKFVKQQTDGLIDKDFALNDQTAFALMNTLYLKDTWLDDGTKLPLTQEKYDFQDKENVVKSLQLLQPDYTNGNVFRGENFTSFYAETYRGYRLKFILPDEGYAIDDVFTQENILLANSVEDYGASDHVNKIHYHTRCLFPQFDAAYDGDVRETLENAFGVKAMFDKQDADFTKLSTDKPLFCQSVRHVTKLKVDRVGIEGAAVTLIPGAGAPGPDGYENVYQDFVVDKTFGFILTDRYDTPLFVGVIDNV